MALSCSIIRRIGPTVVTRAARGHSKVMGGGAPIRLHKVMGGGVLSLEDGRGARMVDRKHVPAANLAKLREAHGPSWSMRFAKSTGWVIGPG